MERFRGEPGWVSKGVSFCLGPGKKCKDRCRNIVPKHWASRYDCVFVRDWELCQTLLSTDVFVQIHTQRLCWKRGEQHRGDTFMPRIWWQRCRSMFIWHAGAAAQEENVWEGIKPKDFQTHMKLPLGRFPHLIALFALMNKSCTERENSDADSSEVEFLSRKSHISLPGTFDGSCKIADC